jgi:hypothetical protein
LKAQPSEGKEGNILLGYSGRIFIRGEKCEVLLKALRYGTRKNPCNVVNNSLVLRVVESGRVFGEVLLMGC